MEMDGACSVDNQGNVYLCGQTNSTDSIATSGSEQPVFGGGADAFLVKFDSTGQRLWGTYYGGTKGDQATYCDADGNDHVILCGITNSTNNISTIGSFQPNLGNPPVYPYSDGFLVLFNGSGQRIWGTYYGGTEWDGVEMCEIGPDHFLYIGGETESPNQMSSSNGFQTSYGGDQDDFLAKFSLGGSRAWGTYYGGSGDESWGSFAVDDSSNVFLCGSSSSSNNISTPGAFQTTLVGSSDAFLVKFDSLCHRIWGTYYGDTAGAGALNCDVTGDTIYLAGGAEGNSNYLVTPDAYQTIYGGGQCDGLVIKFVDCNAPDTADHISGLDTICFPDNSETYSTDPIAGVTSYLWDPPPGHRYPQGKERQRSMLILGLVLFPVGSGCGESTHAARASVKVFIYICILVRYLLLQAIAYPALVKVRHIKHCRGRPNTNGVFPLEEQLRVAEQLLMISQILHGIF